MESKLTHSKSQVIALLFYCKAFKGGVIVLKILWQWKKCMLAVGGGLCNFLPIDILFVRGLSPSRLRSIQLLISI